MNNAQLEMERRIARLEQAVGIKDEPLAPEAETPPDPLAMLDAPIGDIVPALGGLSDADLTALREAEENGKTRVSLMREIDAEIAKRAE